MRLSELWGMATFGNDFDCCVGFLNFWKGILGQIRDEIVLVGAIRLCLATCMKIVMEDVRPICNVQKHFSGCRNLQRFKRAITNGKVGKKKVEELRQRICWSAVDDCLQRRFKVKEFRADKDGCRSRLKKSLGFFFGEQALRVCTSLISSSNFLLHQLSIRSCLLLSRTVVGSALLYERNNKCNAGESCLRPCRPLTLGHAEPLGPRKAIDGRIRHVSSPILIAGF